VWNDELRGLATRLNYESGVLSSCGIVKQKFSANPESRPPELSEWKKQIWATPSGYICRLTTQM